MSRRNREESSSLKPDEVVVLPAARLPQRPLAHLPVMDWLRGLASLAVVFFHLNVVKGDVNDAYTWVCQGGWLGCRCSSPSVAGAWPG